MMRALKDPIYLCILLGPLVWMALSSPWVDRSDLGQFCMWLSVSFSLNLGIVSLSVPWLQRWTRPNGGLG